MPGYRKSFSIVIGMCVYAAMMAGALFSMGSPASAASEMRGVAPFLRGGWSIDCSSPPHLWRIFSSEKAIGPVPVLEEARKTTVSGNFIDVEYSDGLIDRFKYISDDRVSYIYQLRRDGSVYRDWSQYGGVVLHRCQVDQYDYAAAPTELEGGWSYDCTKPPDRWRRYAGSEATGPGTQRYRIQSVSRSGPLYRVTYVDGDGEVFVMIDGDTLRYIYDFDPGDAIRRNWTRKNIVLSRCERPVYSAQGGGGRVDRERGGYAPPSGAANAARDLAKNQLVVKATKCAIAGGLASLAKEPSTKAFIDLFVMSMLNQAPPTKEDVAKQLAFAKVEHELKERGHDNMAMMVSAGAMLDCVAN